LRKILIIDDEIDLCVLLKSYFIKKDYEVIFAHSLSEGLQLLQHYRPDVLFLDNNLPDGTGWNLAPQIANEYPTLQINMISGFHPPLPVMPAKAKFNVFEKPISFSDLDRLMKPSQDNYSNKKLQQ
jgi:Response regulator containing CheY-like receiver, AAA-type ATPase, and DNA-binding domains